MTNLEQAARDTLSTLRDIARNHDCDEDGHKDGTGCRACDARAAEAALEAALSAPAVPCVLLEEDDPSQHGEPAYCVPCYNAVACLLHASEDRVVMLEDLLIECRRDLFYWIDWQKWRRSRSGNPDHDITVATLAGIQQTERLRDRIKSALSGMRLRAQTPAEGIHQKGMAE